MNTLLCMAIMYLRIIVIPKMALLIQPISNKKSFSLFSRPATAPVFFCYMSNRHRSIYYLQAMSQQTLPCTPHKNDQVWVYFFRIGV